jgi:hypothetical protein
MLRELEYELEYKLSDGWLGEVNRRSRDYIRWVQRSLNRIMGAGLAVDGIRGARTRRAIRRFQRQRGLGVDGIVGRRTEAALIAAGASPPPGATVAPAHRATLADLFSFSQRFVRQFRAAKRKIDCADLAIELWISFGERYGIPVSFQIWDARNGRWLVASRSGVRVKSTRALVRRFGSTWAFVRYVQMNLGARHLRRNTYPVAGGHRAAVAGDIFLWEYVNNRTGRRHRWGHTQIIDRVTRGSGGPSTDRITIVQGSLPPIVPVFRTFPATYFYRPRAATLTTTRGREPHTGLLVGTAPRRFKSFRNLR